MYLKTPYHIKNVEDIVFSFVENCLIIYWNQESEIVDICGYRGCVSLIFFLFFTQG